MKNDYIEYYGKHNISPVRQDISNISTHYERRKKLYRQCGIPLIAFRNAEVLEIGPGGGNNTLAFFHWGSRHVDLVEANPKGIKDMQELFVEQGISEDKFEIFPCMAEDYHTDKRYDIVIAEGFLPNIYNQQEIIGRLKELVCREGIIVITCIDDVGFFIEAMKRLVGLAITADISEYRQKTEYLTDFFEPQLAQLRGVSRSPEAWVQDQILNPAMSNGTEMTMMQAVGYFGEGFDVLGSSPQMFTDYSWYKDIWHDYKKDYKEQFERKRLSLLMANMPETELQAEQVDILVKHFADIRKLEIEYEKSSDIRKISEIVLKMDAMEDLVEQNLKEGFVNVFHEIKKILSCLQRGERIIMNKYPHFFAAFGRSQQYISFVKKDEGDRNGLH